MKIADNRLLLGTILAVAVYFAIGFVAPWPPFSAAVNVALVVGSGLLFMRFAPDAADVLFRGRRNEDAPDGDGSHLAIYGTTLIALGGIITATTAFMMAFPATREFVHQNPISLFGRSMASAGFLLVFLSPNVTRRGVQFSGGFWLYLVAAAIVLGVYGLGYSAGYSTDHTPIVFNEETHIPPDRPRCNPVERPVWGSDQGVYHVPSSPYRELVIPVRCFTSAGEAEAAGFRAPG